MHFSKTTFLLFSLFCCSSLFADDYVVSYDRGFSIASPDGANKIAFGGLLQTRLVYDEDTKGRFPAFFVPKARFDVSGNMFRRELAYRFVLEIAPDRIELKDYYLDYTIVPRLFQIRAGRYKTLFARQVVTSDGFYEMVDRSVIFKSLGASRDIGVLFHNGSQQRFEWAGGIFNGGLFARVGANFFSENQSPEGYIEGDLNGGPLRASIALSAIKNNTPSKEIPLRVGGGIDGDIKINGFATTSGWYLGSGDVDGSQEGKTGGFVQLSYVIAQRYQPSFRYGIVDNTAYMTVADLRQPSPNRETRHEILGGFAVYFYRHNLKIQADGGVITTREYAPANGWIFGGATSRIERNPQVRFQLHLAF